MMIYTNTKYNFKGKRRKSLLRAKRKTHFSFETLSSFVSPAIQEQMDVHNNLPSLECTWAPCLKKKTPAYKGTEIVGVATMHKSNLVPVSKNTDSKIFATMRRS
jgi:hypothetical protein